MTKENHSSHQKSSSPNQSSAPHWQCVAHLKGRLKRSRPDEQGDRQLFFAVEDGTLFEVVSMGRPGTDSLLWMWTYAAELFNEDHIWSLYPESRFGKMGVTPVAVHTNPQIQLDLLQFGASVDKRIDLAARPHHLPLFVGRNIGRGFHFMDLTIPEVFELPELRPYQRIQGTAQRQGDRWLLQTLDLVSQDDQNTSTSMAS